MIRTVVFNRFLHPCVVIDVLADMWFEEGIKVFGMSMWTDVVITGNIFSGV